MAYHSLGFVPWEGRCEEEIRPNFSTSSPHAWKAGDNPGNVLMNLLFRGKGRGKGSRFDLLELVVPGDCQISFYKRCL